MLLIGTNNNGIGGADPVQTAAGVKACLEAVKEKQPQARVLLMGLLPRAVGSTDGDVTKDAADARNRRTNEILRGLADGTRITFVDLYEKFLVRGKIPKELMGDYLHPTEKGYAIWRQAIEPLLTP